MYPEIDLSRMLEDPRCAIHVATQEQANAIIYNAQIQFPERISNNWNTDSNYWINYEEETAYTLFFEDDDEPTTMSYADIPWFKEAGYVIIEFDELIAETVEITESDQSFDLILT